MQVAFRFDLVTNLFLKVLCLLLGIEPPHVNQLSPMKKKMRVHYNFSLFQKG